MAFRGDHKKTIDYDRIVEKNAAAFEKVLRDMVLFVCSDPLKPNENTPKLFKKYDELYDLMRKSLATEIQLPEHRVNMDPHKEADIWEALGKRFFHNKAVLQLGPIEITPELALSWRSFTQIAINNHEYATHSYHCISDSLSRNGKRLALLLHFATHDGAEDLIHSEVNKLKLKRQTTYATLRELAKKNPTEHPTLESEIEAHKACLTWLDQTLESIQAKAFPSQFTKKIIDFSLKLLRNEIDINLKQILKKIDTFERYLDSPFKKAPMRFAMGYAGMIVITTTPSDSIPTNFRNQLPAKKLTEYKKKLNIIKNDLKKIRQLSSPGKSDKEFAVILNQKFRALLGKYQLDKEYDRVFPEKKLILEEKHSLPTTSRREC